jgi:hypothetical protein
MQTSVLTRQQLRASAGAPALAPPRCHASRAARAPLRRAAVAGELQTVPAYKGAAVKVKKGELLKVINTHGHQARSVAHSGRRMHVLAPPAQPGSACISRTRAAPLHTSDAVRGVRFRCALCAALLRVAPCAAC